MAWIESHQSLRDHRKVGALSRHLSVRRREAWGMLHGLWWWALDNAPGGLLTDIDPRDIAAACDWGGSDSETPDRLIEALVVSGWLDRKRGRQGRTHLVIHSWPDYAGRLLATRSRISQSKRDYRKSLRINSKGNDPREALHNPTQPNLHNSPSPSPTPPTREGTTTDGPERGRTSTGSLTGAGLHTMPLGLSQRELEQKRQEFAAMARAERRH